MNEESRLPPTLALHGARLRPLRREDADAMYAYLRNPAVTELTSFPDITTSLVDSMLDRYEKRWAAGDWSKWGIARDEDDQVVGMCGFNEWSTAHRWAELAYDLAQPEWGRGLMQQAVTAVLQWAYQQDLVDRVHAFVRVDNRRSVQLLERFGFVREGCLRSYRICRGKPCDFYVYALLRSEWVSANSLG